MSSTPALIAAVQRAIDRIASFRRLKAGPESEMEIGYLQEIKDVLETLNEGTNEPEVRA